MEIYGGYFLPNDYKYEVECNFTENSELELTALNIV